MAAPRRRRWPTPLTELLLAAGAGRPGAGGAGRRRTCRAAARALADGLAATVAAIRARAPTLRLTVDPVEFRGLRYHTGVSITIFAPGRHEELGRGGRYLSGDTEPATGLTLYPDAILRVAAAAPAAPAPVCAARRRPGRRRAAARATATPPSPASRRRRRSRRRGHAASAAPMS